MSPTQTQRELHDMRDTAEREISLGTSTILGIFFALALVCAIFFGFGYTMGRKSSPSPAAVIPAAPEASSDSFKSFKPAPGNPASKDVPPPQHASLPAATEPVLDAPKKPAFDPDAEIVTSVAPATPAKPATRPAVPQAAVSGTAIVQVSAFRRQEDADMVASALRKKGYAVSIRQEPQDNYLHVQLGPYATRKDAEAMKERLSADGFNAIVK